MHTAMAGDERRSQATRNGIGIRPEPVNPNPSFVLKMHLQFYIYAVCIVSFICVM